MYNTTAFRHAQRSWDAMEHPDYWAPDPPEYDDCLMKNYLISECCESDVDVAKNGAKTCSCCGLFCSIHEEKTVRNYMKNGCER